MFDGDGKYMRLWRRIVRVHAPVGDSLNNGRYHVSSLGREATCRGCGYGVCNCRFERQSSVRPPCELPEWAQRPLASQSVCVLCGVPSITSACSWRECVSRETVPEGWELDVDKSKGGGGMSGVWRHVVTGALVVRMGRDGYYSREQLERGPGYGRSTLAAACESVEQPLTGP